MAYYIINANSTLGTKVSDFYRRARECEAVARAFAQKFNPTGKYVAGKYQHEDFAPLEFTTGGVAAIEFKIKPDGWKKYTHPKHKNLYTPRKNNTELVEQFKALPTISHQELSDIIGWEEQTFNNRILFHLGMDTCTDDKGKCTHYGFTVPDGYTYKSIPGVKEVLGTTYSKVFGPKKQ